MDFLFDNPLTSMYGPYFLVFYVLVNIFTLIAVSILKNQLDQTAYYAVPPIPSNPDPFEIAFLRGGENELARAVVFSLVQKNLLKIINQEKASRIYQCEGTVDKRSLKPIEQTALGWFSTVRDAKELFQTGGLAQTLRPYFETYQARLEMQNFLTNGEMKDRRNRLLGKAMAFFAGLGLLKIIVATLSGYTNIFGIIFIGIVGLILIAMVGKLPRLTKLGNTYLERLQLAFEQLKTTNQFINSNQPLNTQPTFASLDPLLLSVGVFGGAVLAGSMYSDYNLAFQKAQQSSGSSSSCGSGCGSSDSSGGDGGGDGGGGGCGGCGGGCGG